MKTKNKYPDWVEKYRSKGCTIRRIRNGYGLYKCTSTREAGLPYPKSKQEYLGMITEKDGFLPKKTTSDHPIYIEYALSSLIWQNFKRELILSSFNGQEDFVRVAIVKYIWGDINEELIRLSFISDGHEEMMINILRSSSKERINRVSRRIEELLSIKIKNDVDRELLKNLLRNCVLDSKNRLSQTPNIPQLAQEIIRNNNLKFSL